jgi:hypothetical protein
MMMDANYKGDESLSTLSLVLDAAEIDERNALAAHDIARAKLRAARSAYRGAVRAVLIERHPPTLPPDFAAAKAMLADIAAKVIAARNLYDGLAALDECDRVLIDAAVGVESARLDQEDLLSTYANRKEVRHG